MNKAIMLTFLSVPLILVVQAAATAEYLRKENVLWIKLSLFSQTEAL